jgi:hypothetical protein
LLQCDQRDGAALAGGAAPGSGNAESLEEAGAAAFGAFGFLGRIGLWGARGGGPAG